MKVTQTIALGVYPSSMCPEVLETFLEAQTRVNMAYLLAHASTPDLYASGVRYRRERGPEQWKDIPTIVRDGYDDGEGLACWLAAELRVRRGIRGARVQLLQRRRDRTLLRSFVAVVEDAEDPRRRWDPAQVLGMVRGRPREEPRASSDRSSVGAGSRSGDVEPWSVQIAQTIALGAYPFRMRVDVLRTFFEAQVRVNTMFLLTHPATPDLYASGVRYRREGSPEQWNDIPTILQDRADDCEGLSCWLAAELRARRGIRGARVQLIRQRRDPNLLHAVVEVVDGHGKPRYRLDPSRVLGMGRDRRPAQPRVPKPKRIRETQWQA